MARAVNAHWTSDVKPLCNSSLQALQGNIDSDETSLFGGCLSGGRWSWLARSSVLEVVDNTIGNRRSAFQFGSSIGDNRVVITCVKEYRYKGSTSLVVGLKTGSGNGMLCVFDPHTSKVVLAIDIPYGVTAIEPVTSVGGLNSPAFALGNQLRLFFGIVAVGTEGGHTYLLDIRLDESESCDEATARGAKVVSPGTTNLRTIREESARRGEHLCLHLDEDSHSFRSFSFRKPDHTTMKSFYPSEVSVTSLYYIKQSGTLAIGFSFGCFQLWELSVPMLEYSSTWTKKSSPVTHFAYQEPEDDPQYFSYFWVGRGPQATDVEQDVPTNLHLFQLMYDKKEVHENYGHLYKELVSCEARFLHDLTFDPFNPTNHSSEGSRIIAAFTLVKELSPNATKQEDTMCDDEGDRLDLGLAAFVWEARSDPADGQTSSSCFLALFDLNRWYHAQMPQAMRLTPGKHRCSYFAFFSLESVLQSASPDFLTDLYINPVSLVPYISSHIPAPESHLQPSSLSFDVICLMEAGLVTAKFLGQQKQVLADLTQQGPSALRDPKAFYNRCWLAGLLPRKSRSDLVPTNASQQEQRDALLTVAVEHNMVGFVMQCINSWTHGDFPSGCNLRTILDWAWGLVTNIKQAVDQICVPFYNGEGTHIDGQTRRLLDQHAVRLGHMITIIQSLLDQSATTTEQGLKDLETKFNVATLLHQHLKAVIWFVRSGLLPECLDEQDLLEGQFCYPAAKLRKIYTRRRLKLQKLCQNSSDGDILMIDGLVSEVGSQLTSLWDRIEEGGTGLYPPPSFHALLDMYLVDTVPVVTKHCIVGYFLLDVLHVSPLSSDQKEQLGVRIDKFCQSFSLPLGVTKLLHGLSLLDRKEFEDAIDMLLDPTTTLELAPWQHRHIIKAFLYQNESKKALQYVRTARPPLTTRDDVKLFLTVLLANGLTGEAFHFQQKYRDEANMEELLTHLILGSQQTKTVDQLLQLPFDREEEAILEQYLHEATEPNSQELLVMHYLQRARYVEAIRLNEKLKQGLMMDSDPAARERATARNAIVESYAKLLPPVQRRLAFSSAASAKRSTLVRREITRPKPLSAVVNPAKSSKVLSNAMLINAVLDRIAEARAQTRRDETPSKIGVPEEEENLPTMEPFIGTPATPRTKTKFGNQSSVIYPEVIGRDVSPWKRQPSPTKTRPVMHTLTVDSTLQFRDKFPSFSKTPVDYTSASALSLLQTPPVVRKTSSKLRNDGTPATHNIPSILKVRSTSRRIPTELKNEKKNAPRAKFEVDLPTPPTLTKSVLSMPLEEPTTFPKRISFAEDTKRTTPSPVMVKTEQSTEASKDIFESASPFESPFLYPKLENLEETFPFQLEVQQPTEESPFPEPEATPPEGTPPPTSEIPSLNFIEGTLTPDDNVFTEFAVDVRASPLTENFELDTGMGMVVDDEITFNFGVPGIFDSETAMDTSKSAEEEFLKQFHLELSSGSENEDEPQSFEEPAGMPDENLDPLSPEDLIPSPRRPLRHMAPDTATPRSASRIGVSASSGVTIASDPTTPQLLQKEDDFATPLPTPEKVEVALFSTPPTSLETEEEENVEMPLGVVTEQNEDVDQYLMAAESVQIQTSPMDLLLPANRQEISVQTTPGLALRQGVAITMTRVPFEASLMSSLKAGPVTPPTSGEDFSGESSSEQVGTQDEPQIDTDGSAESATLTTEDFKLSDETDIGMETNQWEGVQIKQEPVKKKIGRRSIQATPTFPFIFSPPHTRSRTSTRHHAKKVLDEVITPMAQHPTTTLLPIVGPTPSLERVSGFGTPTRDLSISIGGMPVRVTTPRSATGSTKRGRRSHTPSLESFTDDTWNTRVSRRSGTPIPEQKSADISRPMTRSRRSLLTPCQSPTDSPVYLLSPLEEGKQPTPTNKKERMKRVVRIAPHTMTLRTPQERKTRARNVKLW